MSNNINNLFSKEEKKRAKVKYSNLKAHPELFRNTWDELVSQILKSDLPDWGGFVLKPYKGAKYIFFETK